MIGLLVELSISWILLWFFEKKDLIVLGVKPTKSRLSNLFLGFIMASICCAIYYWATSVLAKNSWVLNQQFTLQNCAIGFWFTLKSVVFEELIFRGALLYILANKIGQQKAIILSAIAFGVYHWFSYGAFGNPVQMLFIFVMTGIWGFTFATAFVKTKSLYLPIGLHFGWNLLNTVVFSKGPLGSQLLINTGGQKLQGTISLVAFLFQILALPILTYLYLKRTTLKQS